MISQVDLASDSESDDLDYRNDAHQAARATSDTSDSEKETSVRRVKTTDSVVKKNPIDINSIWKDMNTTVQAITPSVFDYYKKSVLSTETEEKGKAKQYEFAGVRIDPATLKAPVAEAQTVNPLTRRLFLEIGKKYGIKPDPAVLKLSTLQKSKMDWNKHVTDEGLKADLARANKDGYIERVEFLKRTDERRAELIKAGVQVGGCKGKRRV